MSEVGQATCRSCGTLFTAHDGLQATCAELVQLKAENQMLRDNLRSMAERVAGQSELLSKRSEKMKGWGE